MNRASARRSAGVGSPTPADKRALVAALVDQGVETLAAALAAGRSAEIEKYLDVMGRFHRYSAGNCLLIAIQRPDASLVAGYERWRSMGRQVRKGERGIMIMAPCLRRVDVDGDADEPAGDTQKKCEKLSALCKPRALTGFRVAHVFDVAQTDGDALPEPGRVEGDAAAAGAAVGQLLGHAAGLGISVAFGPVPGLPGALGGSAGGRVWIVPGQSPAETLRVLAHELAHEAMHHDGQARPKVVRETEADAVAHVVCRAVGLEVGSACSDYIGMYQGDVATLSASLDRVRRVAHGLIEAIEAAAGGVELAAAA